MRVRLFTIFVVVFLTVLLTGASAYADWHHATFIDGPKSLKNTINFPKLDSDTSVVVFCDADVTTAGRFLSNYCFTDGTRRIWKFEKAVLKAGSRLRRFMSTARANGKSRRVWVQYSVHFSKINGEETISIFPNHGYQTKELGASYQSAQRFKRGSLGYFVGCNRKTNLMVVATIDAEGIPSDIRTAAGQGTASCKKGLVESFSKGRFIPAKANNKFVTSIYAESFFTRYTARIR